MPTVDSIFQRSPNTPAQVDMPAILGSVDAPLLLLGTSGSPSLWINVGTVASLTINGETFTDNGWTILAQLDDNPAGGFVYQTLVDPTKSAVLTKLGERATTGALQRLSQAFLRLLS